MGRCKQKITTKRKEFVGGILKRIDEYSNKYSINMSTEEAIVSDEGVETIDETTSNEKSEDEIEKVEIEEDSVKDDVELPQNPTPSRRGGKRRRRGGRRPAAQERPTVKI